MQQQLWELVFCLLPQEVLAGGGRGNTPPVHTQLGQALVGGDAPAAGDGSELLPGERGAASCIVWGAWVTGVDSGYRRVALFYCYRRGLIWGVAAICWAASPGHGFKSR
jgi:hypothetical protein